MIEYGPCVELAAGLRPEIFKSLCDHSGLTRVQLDHVARTEGVATAIRFAVSRENSAAGACGWSRPAGAFFPTARTHDRGFWRR